MKKTCNILGLLALFMLMSCTISDAQDDDSKYTASLLPNGTEAPAFTRSDPQGNQVSLSDYKGQYVILDFYASWCPDCRKDVPDVMAMYNAFKDRNVAAIGISFDTDKTTWTNYIAQAGMTYPQVSELKKWKETDINALYKIQWIPTIYLVDPDGKIICSAIHASVINKKLEELLGDK